jgi:NodT family efflux transporter outer membrane factor (OMF) lipoprotein
MMVGPLFVRLGARLLSTGIVLALSACAFGNDVTPASTLPDLGRLNAGAAIDEATQSAGTRTNAVDWWKTYGDPQLDRLMVVAAEAAPSMTAAAARIRRAKAVLAGAEADERPSVTGSGQLIGEYFPDHYLYPSPYAGDGGSEGELLADARYHLDFWGKWKAATAAAGERVNAARAEAADAALLLRTAVAEAYVQLDAAIKMHDIAEAGLSRRQGVVDLLAIRTKANLATDIDAVQAQEAITETRSEIARLDGEIVRKRDQIAALLGRDPGFADKIRRPALATIADPAPLSAIPARLLGYRPDVATQRATVEAAAHDIGVAKAAFYPDVDLVGFAGLESLDIGHLLRPGSAAVGAGPAITLPIFDGGRLRSNLKARAADYDAAVSAYDATIVAALQQVADGIVTLKSERARKAEADEALGHWRHVVDLQKIRERQGLSSAMDRLATETALLLSERRSAEADARIAIAQTTLIRALGGAWAPSSFLPTGRTTTEPTIAQAD